MTSPSEDPFFVLSEDLIPSTPPILPARISLGFSGLVDPPLILESDRKEGCGGELWPAGKVLAKYLLQCRMAELRGKTIVELGAGSGLVGLALGLHSPDMTIHLTDLAPMLPLIQKNVSLNPSLVSSVHPSILSWGSASPPVASESAPTIPTHPDVLLAADCVYFEPSFPLLSATMQHLIGPDTVCYFCFQKRRRADMTFVKGLRKMFSVRDVTDDPDQPVWQREGLFLYEIRQKPNLSPPQTSPTSPSPPPKA